MINLSLRTKILLTVEIIILFVLATSTLVHFHSLKDNYFASMEWHAEMMATSIIDESINTYQGVSTGQEGEATGGHPEYMRLYEFSKDKNITHIGFIDASGMIAAHSDKALEGTLLESPLLRAQLDHREQMTVPIETTYHILIPIFENENIYRGTVDVGMPRRVVDGKIRQFLYQAGVVFGIFALLTFFTISVILHLLVTKPLRNLVSVAEKIARGELIHKGRLVLESAIDRHKKAKASNELSALTVAFHDIVMYLQDMTNVATRIAIGDLNQNIVPRSADDVLSKAFQRMSTYLCKMASVATAIASGDLRQVVQPVGEHDVLGIAFQNMASLHHAVQQIMDEAASMKNTSGSLSEISMQMSSEAEQTSQQVRVISEISRQVSEDMLDISIATKEVSESICEISRSMNDVTIVMSEAVIFANSANVAIADLEERSQEIGNIIQAISSITQQTNLLALNATIEAARAGESGRGFKVVANEVKTLAEEIAGFTEDITHKVEAMQSSSKNATKTLSEIADTICKTDEFINVLLETTEQQKATANEIARSIADSTQGSGQVSEAIVDIAAMTEHTKDRIAKIRHASEELDSLGNQLHQLLSQFKV